MRVSVGERLAALDSDLDDALDKWRATGVLEREAALTLQGPRPYLDQAFLRGLSEAAKQATHEDGDSQFICFKLVRSDSKGLSRVLKASRALVADPAAPRLLRERVRARFPLTLLRRAKNAKNLQGLLCRASHSSGCCWAASLDLCFAAFELLWRDYVLDQSPRAAALRVPPLLPAQRRGARKRKRVTGQREATTALRDLEANVTATLTCFRSFLHVHASTWFHQGETRRRKSWPMRKLSVPDDDK